MEHLYSAGVIVYDINEHNEPLYLLLKYGAGHWDFAKGKIEKGESKIQAALRELQEEAGITAHLDDNFEETFSYIFTDYNKQLTQKTVYFFIGSATSTSITLSHEHIDYAWLPYKKALETLTFENAKKVLKKAHAYLAQQST
jgi:8-oxo-dGTP pyrophosphatase MutT (NUDIX family)